MGNEGKITLEEAVKLLAVAKLQIAEQQQELKSKDAVISEKDLKINAQISLLNQKNKELEAEKKEKEDLRIENLRLQEELSSQLAHRFCSHSEKVDNQPSLFDFEDEGLIPSESEIAETVAGEGPYKEEKVRAYIRRKCGRKAIDDSTPTKQIYHDIPEEEKICACGCRLKKVGENSKKRLRIITSSGAVEYDTKGRTVKEGMTEFIAGDLHALLASVPKMTELYTSYEYDEKDRRVQTTLPDGEAQYAEFEIRDGKTVAYSIDPLENVSVQETDSQGNIVRTAKKDKSGKQLTEVGYNYNELGEMLSAFDAKGHPIKAEYDLLGRRTALESLDSGRQEFFYDESSNLVRETNSVLRERNKQIIYEYDGLNRLIKIDYPDTEDTVYTYGSANDTKGAAGKILKVEDASGTLEYEYGKLGEIIKERRLLKTHLNAKRDKEMSEMEYRSDYLGRMQSIVYPDGEKVVYGYDRGGQVVSVTGEHYGTVFKYVTNILYDQYGQRTRIDYGNGTFTEYNYDPARRWLDSIKTENKWGQNFQNIRYSFDAVGNVLGYENDCLDSVSGNYKTKQTYSYDSLYQLIKVSGETVYNPYRSSVPEFMSNYSQMFEFDSDGLGNMTSKVSTETVKPQKAIGDNLNYRFDYEYDGNFAHRLKRAGERYYKYDANYATAYVYGQDGQRSNKYTQNSETLYFNKMWTLHTDRGNNVYRGQFAKNIYLGETRIVTKLNSGENPTYQKQYYYHSDHLGSASLISDYKGDEYQRIEYAPYGETWVEKTQNTGLDYLPYRFTGKEMDEETGLYYYGARYLDAKYSRWISTDLAMGDYISGNSTSGGLYNTVNFNLYHYAGNNPIVYTDPDGRDDRRKSSPDD